STGQVSANAAEIYELFFVPALFSEWAPRVVEATGLASHERALDVACGTGVVARQLALCAGPERVHALDRNAGMLEVARRHADGISWHEGRAEALPFPDESFDVLTCQFGLMFFEDRIAALREMQRVLRPGGRLCLAVWGPLESTPGYHAMTELLRELFGPAIAQELAAPYCLGDREALSALLTKAWGTPPCITSLVGSGRFPSLSDWIHTDVKGWTLADRIDAAGLSRLLEEAPKRLARFVLPDGQVEFASPGHLASWTKPQQDV
ncbi:MAG: methyltransferase domain-containing protein, partial [Myxococcales bacterium]|nr:methyltransferase domain-containing protein [Myxococcales bacterium]